jgi:hypothetical protein
VTTYERSDCDLPATETPGVTRVTTSASEVGRPGDPGHEGPRNHGGGNLRHAWPSVSQQLLSAMLVLGSLTIGVSHATTLVPIGSIAEGALADLESEKSEARIRAVRTLGLTPGMGNVVDDVVGRVVELLENDPDPMVRAEVAYILAETTDPITSYSRLVRGLQDDDCAVRQAVAYLFGRRNLLLNLDSDLRADAASMLSQMTQQPSCLGEKVSCWHHRIHGGRR